MRHGKNIVTASRASLQIASLLLASLLSANAWGQNAAASDAPAATVLFICEHGNVKSLMAASYFNQLAHDRHLPFVAISRGVAPDSDTVPPGIVGGLRSEGFDVSSFHPAKVTAQEVTAARRVIAISVPSTAAIAQDHAAIVGWDDVPPASVDFKASSASIKAHIEALVESLQAQ